MNEFGNFSLDQLQESRLTLLIMKDEKLKKRTNKHLNDPLELPSVVTHLHEEYIEFLKGYGRDDRENMKEELVDLSNVVDILFMILSQKKSAIPEMKKLFEESSRK